MTILQLKSFMQERNLCPAWYGKMFWRHKIHFLSHDETYGEDFFAQVLRAEQELQDNLAHVPVNVNAQWLEDEQRPAFDVRINGEYCGSVGDWHLLHIMAVSLDAQYKYLEEHGLKPQSL